MTGTHLQVIHNMTTISELLTMKDGDAVNEVQGQIIEAFERRNINGKYGATTVQDAILMDSSGKKIAIAAWGHPDLKALQGKEYVLHANKGEGLKIKFNSYTPKGATEAKVVIQLEVGRKGTFQHVEVYGHDKPNKGAVPADLPGSGKQTTPGDQPERQRPVKSVLGTMDRLANLYMQCFETVDRVVNPEIAKRCGQGLSPDMFQSAVSCLYIQANRDNVVVQEVSWRPMPPTTTT